MGISQCLAVLPIVGVVLSQAFKSNNCFGVFADCGFILLLEIVDVPQSGMGRSHLAAQSWLLGACLVKSA